MRIAFVTPEFVTENYYSGGLANYLYRISKTLTTFNHEIHVLTLSDIDQSDFDYDGIHVHRITSGRLRKTIDALSAKRLRTTSCWLDFSFKVYRKLNRLCRREAFDIIQFPNYSFCGLFTALFMKAPYVVRISSYRPAWNTLSGVRRNPDIRVSEWLELLQLRLCRHMYAPSFTLKRMLSQEAGLDHVQVIRPPFYIETAAMDESVYHTHLKKRNYLLFFGRFQLHKGFHILARALPRVLQMHPDCHAAFVGLDMATPLAPSMQAYAQTLCEKYTDRLIFIGQTPHARLYPIIRHARLIVLPSLIDNLPNTCLEAMTLGRPVIGTQGASFDELITDGENGFLVPSGDSDALATKINAAWSHPRLDEIGRAAREEAAEFAPERTATDLVEYYKQVLDR